MAGLLRKSEVAKENKQQSQNKLRKRKRKLDRERKENSFDLFPGVALVDENNRNIPPVF